MKKQSWESVRKMAGEMRRVSSSVHRTDLQLSEAAGKSSIVSGLVTSRSRMLEGNKGEEHHAVIVCSSPAMHSRAASLTNWITTVYDLIRAQQPRTRHRTHRP